MAEQELEQEKEDYKFPDEIEVELDSTEPEIEVEDNTPPEDRGRTPLPKSLLDEIDSDELEEYSEKAQQRLKQMRKTYHDERREREAAQRERDDAANLTRKLLDENKKLREAMVTGGTEYVTSRQQTAKLMLDQAKANFKIAYESGDSDALVDANLLLQEATLKAQEATNLQLPTVQETPLVVQQPPSTPQPTVDAAAAAWQKGNPWFGQDQEMTATALGIHNKLLSEGVEVSSTEYYDALNKTMRKRYSDYEWGDVPAKAAKPAVVAPATRSTSVNKIKLSTSQVQLAKRLGLTLEQYAREAHRLETQHG